MTAVSVRAAAESDAAALLDIYAPYVDTPITFEGHVPTVREFSERIRGISSFYPYLVCEAGGAPVGYAYAHRLREREAYDWDAELSVYIKEGFTGGGIGKALYTAVIGLLAAQGFRHVYGCLVLPNDRSEALHRACGFSEAGVWPRVGYKCGRWYDIKWYGRTIGALEDAPAPAAPLPQLPPETVAAVLERARAEIEARLNP